MNANGIKQATLHTATFMLTGIERSARLQDSAPTTLGAVVSRHEELLDEAISRHGGQRRLYQDNNNGAMAAFTRALDAVVAALDIQRALHRESRPNGPSPKLRIALQTAQPQHDDEADGYGWAISRCAQLRAVAHDGQVLLSRATRDVVVDQLPEDAELIDLGTHRLGDLGRPEHVFGLRHPDWPAEFPALRSLSTMPNNLPSELTRFVGRRAELAQISDLLQRMRLVTLTGAGGCGKTRLALQTAANALDRYSEGVWWVELARLEDATLVPAAVIGALGLHEVRGGSLLDTLADYLRERCALIILDNCEHLLGACAGLVDALLRACPSLTILATSRAPLGVPGEMTWQVPSMSLPAQPRYDPIEVLRQCDAVSLFIDRAMQVRSSFTMTAGNAPAVVQICRDLDGIPLAIELAAARVRVLAPEQIASALSDRFRLLTGGARTVLPRHQTLQASLNWSHELLNDAERTLLRRLAVFAGGWTLEAAEQVCPGEGIDRHRVLDLLTGLVDKSLVTTDDRGGHTRYGLLETVRQYAAARLADAGELNAVRDRHLAYYLGLAEDADAQALDAERDDPGQHDVAIELPNLRAALERAAATKPAIALHLVDALTLFWLFTGRYQQGDTAYARALDAAGEQPTPLRGRVLSGRGILGMFGSAYEVALASAQQALAVGQACGDLWAQGRAYLTVGLMTSYPDPVGGRALLDRGVQLATEAGDGWGAITAAQALATTWMWQDDFDTARPILDDAYATATRLGYSRTFAWHWFCLGWEAAYRGQLDEARQLFTRAAAANEASDPFTRSFANGLLAYTELVCGETTRAHTLATKVFEHVLEAGAGPPLGWAHHALGSTEMALGNLTSARQHFTAAVEGERRLGFLFQLTWHLTHLGTLERVDGNLDAAQRNAAEALDVARRLGSGYMMASAERLLSRLALAAGKAIEAQRYAHDALGRLVTKGFALDIPECLDILAAIAATRDSFEEAARLLGAAAAGRDRLGTVRFPSEPQFWTSIECATQEALGSDGYQAAFTAGAALETDQAIAYARRARGERKRPSHGWDSLTPTELEIARHIAAGRTNRQIGQLMFVSAGTVKTHLAHIFTKLGTTSRSHLAAEATRHRLDASETDDQDR